MKTSKVLFTVQAAVIAALYVVLTVLANSIGLASSAIQIRFSEALTILPFFTPAAIPGLFVGCILSNLLTGCVLLDVIFGSLATLIGAVGTYLIRRGFHHVSKYSRIQKWAASLPPILANTLIVPWILSKVYSFEGSILYFMLTVGIGELISCGVLGMILFCALEPQASRIFHSRQ